MELCYLNNPKSLFRKYNFLVTSLGKHQLVRDYLDIKSKNPISLLLPNGYCEVLEKGKNQYLERMVVASRAVYAPKLYPALVKLDLVANWLNDFKEAQRFLAGQLGLINTKEFLPLLLKLPHFDTFITNPDATPESTSVDGQNFAGSAGDTWATIRAATTGTAGDTATTVRIDCTANAGGTLWTELTRAFILFDTSGFQGSWIFEAGSNTVVGRTNGISAQGSLATRLVTSTPASNTAIVAEDFDQQGTVTQATADTNPTTDATDYTWTLDGTGEGNLAIPGQLGSGITKFGWKLAADANNSEPTLGASFVYGESMRSAEGITNIPTLTINYISSRILDLTSKYW